METPDEIRAELRVVLLAALPRNLRAAFNELMDGLESERDEANANWQAEADEDRQYEEVLEAVKYWLQDVLYLDKPVRDPRGILRLVERTLDP